MKRIRIGVAGFVILASALGPVLAGGVAPAFAKSPDYAVVEPAHGDCTFEGEWVTPTKLLVDEYHCDLPDLDPDGEEGELIAN